MDRLKKFPLNQPGTDHKLQLPIDAQVFSLTFENPLPVLWALVDSSETEIETREFTIVVAGDVPGGGALDISQFIGSYVTGSASFHVFETTPPPMSVDRPARDVEILD